MWWPVLAGCSLLAGLAALASAARPAGEVAPASRLLVHLPGPVTGVVAISGALAVLLFFILGLLRGRRRRREDEDELEFDTRRPRIPRWLRPIVGVLALLPYVLLAYVLRGDDGTFLDIITRLAEQIARLTGLQQPLSPAAERPVASSPLFTGAVAVLALCTGLGSLALVLWIFFGERVAQWWAGSPPDDEPDILVDAVEESLDDLRLEPDPRVAIIKCYGRFETALARSRVPRAPWQTPLEFMQEALSRLPLPRGSVHRLTGLFELSRFSDEPLGPADRDAAWESLLEIKVSLALRESRVPPN